MARPVPKVGDVVEVFGMSSVGGCCMTVAAVWLVIEREPWEADRVVAICASKAGAWRDAYRRRYEHAVEEREDQLRGYDPWTRPAVVIERRDLLP